MNSNLVIFILFYSILLITKTLSDICNVCHCDVQNKNNTIFIHCGSGVNNNLTLELENIQWPIDEAFIVVGLNEQNFSYIPKILGTDKVISLNLENNLIEYITPDPFQYVKNVEYISLKNNSIAELNKDMFKSTKKLFDLNLSHNLLSDLNKNALSQLKTLTRFDISYNKLALLSIEILEALPNLKILNLECNNIVVIQSITEATLLPISLTDLNLSYNKLTVITIATEIFDKMETLNVSHNTIINIEKESFYKLVNLKRLDLSYNKLEDLSLLLPDSVEYLILSHNYLESWPIIHKVPRMLQNLEIQNNKLIELFNDNSLVEHLELLNATNNQLYSIPTVNFTALKILDLSNNYFTNIPLNLNSIVAPVLDILIFDNNPIEVLSFNGLSVSRLSLNNISTLQILNEGAFESVNDDREACLDLSISHCNNLMHIHPDAFGELYMCKLDLSYNNLYVLSENLTNWANLVNGINLQGNPFICTCSSQWMLDTILNQLYENEEQQYLLKDLRCGNSESFGGHRFVHYYRRIGALCNPSVPLKMQQEETLYAGFGNLQLNRGPGVFIITLLCFIILIALVFLGIYFTKEQKKKLSRVNQKFQFYDY